MSPLKCSDKEFNFKKFIKKSKEGSIHAFCNLLPLLLQMLANGGGGGGLAGQASAHHSLWHRAHDAHSGANLCAWRRVHSYRECKSLI